MNFNFKLDDHPAQARHPVNGEPFFDADGNPVPLFPDQRCIRLDGTVIAYVSESGNVNFIMPQSKLSQAVCDAAKEFAAKEFKTVERSHQVVEPPPIEEEEEEDE